MVKESTMLIEDIDAKGVSGNNSWIKLPKMYTRTELPVDKEDIPTPDKNQTMGLFESDCI